MIRLLGLLALLGLLRLFGGPLRLLGLLRLLRIRGTTLRNRHGGGIVQIGFFRLVWRNRIDLFLQQTQFLIHRHTAGGPLGRTRHVLADRLQHMLAERFGRLDDLGLLLRSRIVHQW